LAIARDPSAWTPALAQETIRSYADLAPTWNDDRGGYRPVALRDALSRGGPFPNGDCVEIGSGTGLLTSLIRAHWPRVVSIDLSHDMLSRAPGDWNVRADARDLPLPDRSMAAAVLADCPLFAGEVCRVLRAGGVLVVSNALGDAAPHHVAAQEVLAALQRQDSSAGWAAVASEAGWGSWMVARRVAL
jgi:SAM-dependent methyltransferase